MVANVATFEELDIDARLNARAAQHIVERRDVAPFETLDDVDDVKFVGVATLQALEIYSVDREFLAQCQATSGEFELQIISDIDKTVLPPESEEAYAGVVKLYNILELGDGSGASGDMNYVTARTPERLEGVPEWMDAVGLPPGPIETGVSGIPWIAEDEKVGDVTEVLSRTQAKRWVMFGDTSHRDPEVYRRIIEANPDHEIVALVNLVNNANPDRLVGLHAYHNYAEASAFLVEEGILTEDEAWSVWDAAVAEGLDMTAAEMEALLK